MEYKNLSAELRNILKARGITYKDVANAMEMSESGVKKLLTSKDISFNKLENILKIAKLDLKTLLAVADSESKQFTKLTKDQEAFLANNIRHYNFFAQLQHFEMDIKKLKQNNPKVSRAKIEKYLNDLEAIGLIQRDGGIIRSALAKGFRFGDKLESTTLKQTNAVFSKKLEHLHDDRKNNLAFYGVGKFSLAQKSLIEFRTAQKLLLTEFSDRSVRESKIYAKNDLVDIGYMQVSVPMTQKELHPID